MAVGLTAEERIIVRNGSSSSRAFEILSIVTPPRSGAAGTGATGLLKKPIMVTAPVVCACANGRLIGPRGLSSLRIGGETTFDGTNDVAILPISGVITGGAVGWLGGRSSSMMRDCAGAMTLRNVSSGNRLN